MLLTRRTSSTPATGAASGCGVVTSGTAAATAASAPAVPAPAKTCRRESRDGVDALMFDSSCCRPARHAHWKGAIRLASPGWPPAIRVSP